MRWNFIIGIIGILLIFLGLAMIFPMGVSLYFQDQAHRGLAAALGITLSTGLILSIFSRRLAANSYINQKEGMAVVALGWISIGIFGALPFFFSPAFGSFTDAVFESISGFSTTGSSIMTNIEGAAPSILFWRSLIQWLGGMGIIVLSLAILPFLGTGGIQLYKAEVPSPVPDKLTPRLSDSAKILWMLYAGLTILEAFCLGFGGMSWFDALCHSLTSLPTGGFSPKNLSVAHYNSTYIDMVITVFMLLAGINFSLHFQLLTGRPLAFWKDTECRFFLSLILICTVLIAWNTFGSVYDSLGQALRFSVFQVTSIITTTGFATADYEQYPGFSQVILFVCMFIGGSAGSTGGGMKCARIIVCAKFCYRELFRLIHPRNIRYVKMNNQVISNELMRSIMGFLALYMFVFFAVTIVLAGMGLDMMTALGATVSCLGNIGPGFGTVGPAENFAHLPVAAKWLLSWCMLLGRLEIYTFIILLVPEFWRH